MPNYRRLFQAVRKAAAQMANQAVSFRGDKDQFASNKRPGTQYHSVPIPTSPGSGTPINPTTIPEMVTHLNRQPKNTPIEMVTVTNTNAKKKGPDGVPHNHGHIVKVSRVSGVINPDYEEAAKRAAEEQGRTYTPGEHWGHRLTTPHGDILGSLYHEDGTGYVPLMHPTSLEKPRYFNQRGEELTEEEVQKYLPAKTRSSSGVEYRQYGWPGIRHIIIGDRLHTINHVGTKHHNDFLAAQAGEQTEGEPQERPKKPRRPRKKKDDVPEAIPAEQPVPEAPEAQPADEPKREEPVMPVPEDAPPLIEEPDRVVDFPRAGEDNPPMPVREETVENLPRNPGQGAESPRAARTSTAGLGRWKGLIKGAIKKLALTLGQTLGDERYSDLTSRAQRAVDRIRRRPKATGDSPQDAEPTPPRKSILQHLKEITAERNREPGESRPRTNPRNSDFRGRIRGAVQGGVNAGKRILESLGLRDADPVPGFGKQLADQLTKHGAAVLDPAIHGHYLEQLKAKPGFEVQYVYHAKPNGERVPVAAYVSKKNPSGKSVARQLAEHHLDLHKTMRAGQQRGLNQPKDVWSEPEARSKAGRILMDMRRMLGHGSPKTPIGHRMPGTGLKLAKKESPDQFDDAESVDPVPHRTPRVSRSGHGVVNPPRKPAVAPKPKSTFNPARDALAGIQSAVKPQSVNSSALSGKPGSMPRYVKPMAPAKLPADPKPSPVVERPDLTPEEKQLARDMNKAKNPNNLEQSLREQLRKKREAEAAVEGAGFKPQVSPTTEQRPATATPLTVVNKAKSVLPIPLPDSKPNVNSTFPAGQSAPKLVERVVPPKLEQAERTDLSPEEKERAKAAYNRQFLPINQREMTPLERSLAKQVAERRKSSPQQTLPMFGETTGRPQPAGSRSRQQSAKRPARFALANQSMAGAIRTLQTKQQQQLRKIASKVLTQLGLAPHKLADAVHDTQSGARPGVAQSIMKPVSPEHTRRAAARYGLLSGQSNLLVFHGHPDGQDSLYSLQIPGGEQGRSMLDQAGINKRVLIPNEKGFRVVIHDPGRQLRPNVEQLATALNTPVFEQIGTGEHIGAGENEPDIN